MTVAINANELAQLLKPLGALIPKRVHIPTFANIRFDVIDSLLFASVFDLQSNTFAKAYQLVNTLTTEPGVSFSVNAKELLRILASFKKSLITLKPTDTKLVLADRNMEINMELQPYEFFEKKDFIREVISDIHSKKLSDLLSRMVLFASTDELKNNMNGAYLNIEKDNLTAVATDAHKLIALHTKVDTIGIDMVAGKPTFEGILNLKAIKTLQDLLKNTSSNSGVMVSTTENEDFFFFYGENFTLYTKSIDSNFPLYKDVIQKDHPIFCIVKRADLIDTCKTFFSHSDSANKIFVQILEDKKTMEICCSNSETGFKSFAKLQALQKGESILFAISCKYLHDACKSLDSEFVKLEFSSPSKAIHLSDPDAQNNDVRLVMPVMIGNYHNSPNNINWESLTE